MSGHLWRRGARALRETGLAPALRGTAVLGSGTAGGGSGAAIGAGRAPVSGSGSSAAVAVLGGASSAVSTTSSRRNSPSGHSRTLGAGVGAGATAATPKSRLSHRMVNGMGSVSKLFGGADELAREVECFADAERAHFFGLVADRQAVVDDVSNEQCASEYGRHGAALLEIGEELHRRTLARSRPGTVFP